MRPFALPLQSMFVVVSTAPMKALLRLMTTWSLAGGQIGLPVVVSRVGGLPEVVDEGRSGLRLAGRDALKQLIHSLIAEIGELGVHTGRFHERVGRHVATIEAADSILSLIHISEPTRPY